MHNYSTPYAVKLLKNLIPALKPGARVIINDHCLLEPGQENPWDETVMRRMDLVMLALLNAQERTEAEFRELFKSASDGFVFKVCFTQVTRTTFRFGVARNVLSPLMNSGLQFLNIGRHQTQGMQDEHYRGCLAT